MEEKRILVVEDEAVIAMDLHDQLEKLGYKVVAAVPSGEQAIAEAKIHRPDLVLMDIMLEGKSDGITAACQIRSETGAAIIFLTAFADEETVTRATAAEPFGYIVKPFDAPELRAAIEIALHKHSLEAATHRTANSNTAQPGATRRLIDKSEAQKRVVNSEFRLGALHTAQEFLARVDPLSRLVNEDFERLAQAAHFSIIPSGQCIAYEGDEDPASFIVAAGRVAMFKTSQSGKELIVELVLPGDLRALFISLERLPYPLTARAQGDAKILFIQRAVLAEIVDRYPELYKEFMDLVSRRLRSSHDLSRGLAHDRVEMRIVSALTSLAPQCGRLSTDKSACTLEITRQELADLTGTSPETAIRITKAMERDNLLDLTRAGYIKILDLEGLKQHLQQ